MILSLLPSKGREERTNKKCTVHTPFSFVLTCPFPEAENLTDSPTSLRQLQAGTLPPAFGPPWLLLCPRKRWKAWSRSGPAGSAPARAFAASSSLALLRPPWVRKGHPSNPDKEGDFPRSTARRYFSGLFKDVTSVLRGSDRSFLGWGELSGRNASEGGRETGRAGGRTGGLSSWQSSLVNWLPPGSDHAGNSHENLIY